MCRQLYENLCIYRNNVASESDMIHETVYISPHCIGLELGITESGVIGLAQLFIAFDALWLPGEEGLGALVVCRNARPLIGTQ